MLPSFNEYYKKINQRKQNEKIINHIPLDASFGIRLGTN